MQGAPAALHDSSELGVRACLSHELPPGLAVEVCCFKKMLEGSSDACLRSPSREPGFLFFQYLPDVVRSLTGEDVIVFTSKVTSFPEPPHSA